MHTAIETIKTTNTHIRAYSYARVNKAFALAFLLGMIDGYKVLPKELHVVAYLGISAACGIYVLQRNEERLFQMLPFLLYGELYVRDSFVYFPYNFLPYLCNLLFIVLLVRQKITTGRHSTAFYFLAGYAILEFIDLGRTRDLQYAWMLFTNSLLLMLLAMWGSYNYLSAKNSTAFLPTYKWQGCLPVATWRLRTSPAISAMDRHPTLAQAMACRPTS